jgi:transcription elongation factor GreB
VADKPSDQDRIFFAAWVLLLSEQETEVLYHIVGGDEFEMDKRYISVDSPDDSVTIKTVAHTLTYSVLDIQYGLDFIED